MKRFATLLLILFIFAFPAASVADTPINVTVKVSGLTCPFCAYGLEKKLKNMDGVENLTIDVEGGKVEIVFKDGKFFRKDKVEEIVKEAGFTPGVVEVKESK